MAIATQAARGIFTKAFLAIYKESIKAPSFLSSFFKSKTTTAKQVSIEVQRGTEKIAVDVMRGTSGNRNQFSLFTEKIYIPPFFNENFDATALDFYDRLFGRNVTPTREVIGGLATEVGNKLTSLRAKIERAKELMAAQVFETGVVLMKNGDSLDFKRKATSMKDNSAAPWTEVATPVEAQLIAGGNFIRTTGKNVGKTLDLILSSDGWVALKKTNYFKDNANFRNVQLMDITTPQGDSRGAAYHGRITAGSFTFNVWTYDEQYTNAAGVSTRYTDPTNAIILPSQGTNFIYAHAGIPAIITDKARVEFPQYIAPMAAEYWINNYIDKERKAHTFEIMSAPAPVPVTVDMIYTMQILGDANPEVG